MRLSVSENATRPVNIARVMLTHLQKRKNQDFYCRGLMAVTRVKVPETPPGNDIVGASTVAGCGEKPVTYKIAESGTVRRSESAPRHRTITPMIAGLFSFPEGTKTRLLGRANNLTISEVIGKPQKVRKNQC
jgi:hypothetical protein